MSRKDLDRLLEVLLLQETRILKQSKSLQEYYNVVENAVYEFLNPNQSYNYTATKVGEGYLYKVEKISNDPQFVITLKKNGNSHVLDFYWPETEKGFERVDGLEGVNYLDTLVKVLQAEILPMLASGEIKQILFAPYQADSGGKLRDKVFSRITERFVDTKEFTILKKADYTLIKKVND